MPTIDIPKPQQGMTLEELTDVVFKLQRTLEYLSSHIDDDNIFSVSIDKLIAGTAKIDTAWIEDLIVGSNVTMGPEATISWANVTGDKPSQYTDAMALDAWEASGYKTYIDAYGVYSGSFKGGMFEINPTGSQELESGLTVGGYWQSAWHGEALRLQYTETGNGGFPGTVFSSAGGVDLVFDVYAKFKNYVDFSAATVQGLNVIARYA